MFPIHEANIHAVELTDPVFVSDIHIANAPQAASFIDFLHTEAAAHAELVVLGDLFDAWPGDEKLDEYPELVSALRAFSSERPLYVMHGNRDFFLGKAFKTRTGANLLADPCVATVQGLTLLVSHGDAWCTKDLAYQKARRWTKGFLGQLLLTVLPYAARVKIAGAAKTRSAQNKRTLQASAFEVVDADVALPAGRPVDAVVHGHTHRPGRSIMPSGIPRYTLPDWRFSDRGLASWGWLSVASGELQLQLRNRP